MGTLDLLTLPESAYIELPAIRSHYGLDFDDAYQFALAREYGLKIVTMDKDFQTVRGEVEVKFLLLHDGFRKRRCIPLEFGGV